MLFMKKVMLIFLLFLQSVFFTQDTIAGAYHVSSGNPDDGGYNWVLLNDHRFAMFTFGQVIAGKWSADSNHIIHFTPAIPQYPFEVYGRYNADEKGTKVMFQNFDINEDAFFGNSVDGLQPVFVENANCLPYPLVNSFHSKFKDLVFANFSYQAEKETAFVTGTYKFNDFIIMYHSSRVRIAPFQATLKNGRLTFRDSSKASSERKDIEKNELKEIEKYLPKENAPTRESLVVNKAYNIVSYGIYDNGEEFDEQAFLSGNYTFDSSNEIYKAKEKYTVQKGDEYHDYNILYKYHKVEIKPTATTYKKSPKGIFNITCKD